MALDPAKSPPPSKARAIVQRTRGRTHGPVTRLMSPSDLGELPKPFVFLDLFDHEGAPFNGGLHPHSGIATLTYVAEGVSTRTTSRAHCPPAASNGCRLDAACGTAAGSTMQAGRAASSSGSPCRRNSNWVRP